MDDAAIRLARAGDQEAFRRLIDLYGQVAQRTARAYLQDREAAEDAVQEAWVDAWRKLDTFQPGKPFRPWLLTLVVNRCRMKVRRKRFPFVPFSEALSVPTSRPVEGDPALILAYGDPELAQALASLNADTRRLLALRYYADLDLAEVAQAMGIPLGTVKSRLHRTLRTLRSTLECPSALPGQVEEAEG